MLARAAEANLKVRHRAAFHSSPYFGRAVVATFASCIFFSSTLLFVVQPMFAKMILPKLGGTPAVWNTCLVFFQACLLVGYAYAHFATKWIGVRRQAIAHLLLMPAALLVLPLTVPAIWIPPATANPVLSLLWLMMITVGPPFVIVSASSPLLQKWFATTNHRAAQDPYFLYAAGNLGSMVALLSYPAFIEPTSGLMQQSFAWSIGYGLLIVMTLLCALFLWLAGNRRVEDEPSTMPQGHVDREQQSPAPTTTRRLHWLVLSFVPSSYLLGVTTYMTSDVAAVPLLWVIPLAMYLLTFILVFLRRPIISHRWVGTIAPIVILAVVMTMAAQLTRPVGMLIVLHLLAFFVVAMMCHGELARLRPDAQHLTEFYLILSIGGVLGGAFNALVAPVLFRIPIEYSIAIALACLLIPVGTAAARKRVFSSATVLLDSLLPGFLVVLTWMAVIAISLSERGPVFALRQAGFSAPAAGLMIVAVPAAIALLTIRRPVRFGLCIMAILGAWSAAALMMPDLLLVRRSFFGVHRVTQIGRSTPYAFHELFHGTTVHGRQRIDPETGVPIRPRLATSYYHHSGPIAHVMEALLSRPDGARPANFAVVGLGGGNLAAYADRGMKMTFYEIDPVIKAIAEDTSLFTYISAARGRGAVVPIVLGDARLTIAKHAPDRSIDVLIFDAFTGDAVPTHLLTAEAMELYASKLRDDGLVVFHISNHSVELRPVVAALVEQMGWASRLCDDESRTIQQHAEGKYLSMWMIAARSEAGLGTLATDPRWTTPPPTRAFLWTDDFSNIVRLLKW